MRLRVKTESRLGLTISMNVFYIALLFTNNQREMQEQEGSLNAGPVWTSGCGFTDTWSTVKAGLPQANLDYPKVLSGVTLPHWKWQQPIRLFTGIILSVQQSGFRGCSGAPVQGRWEEHKAKTRTVPLCCWRTPPLALPNLPLDLARP